MKTRQYLSLFFLFAVLLIVAHSVIPHHHHADSFFTHFRDYCPASQTGHNIPPDTPLHCHAFNDLNLFRETNADISALIGFEPQAILPDIIQQLYFICINHWSPVLLLDDPHINLIFITKVLLRAPPAFS